MTRVKQKSKPDVQFSQEEYDDFLRQFLQPGGLMKSAGSIGRCKLGV